MAGLAPSSQTVGSNIRVRKTEAKEVGKVEATLQVAPNGGVQESANISAPSAAIEYLLADLESP